MKSLSSLSVLRVALVGALVSAPVHSGVTFFSDRSIETIAGKLKLPEGAEVSMPRGRAARVEELADVVLEVESSSQELAAREAEVFAQMPALRERLAVLHAIPLAMSDRAALVEGGLEALPTQLRQSIQEAAAPLQETNGQLRAYFDVYDRYQRATIRAKIYATNLEILEQREALNGVLSGRKLRKLDKGIAQIIEFERRFRIFTSHPKSKNHHKALSAIVCQRRGAGMLARLQVALGKAGLAPKRTWQDRFKKISKEVVGITQATKAGLASAPAVAKLLGYLYNPFRKERDPEVALKRLKGLSRGFRLGTGMKLEVEGEEEVPQDRPVVFAFSHRSELEDAILMLGATPGDDFSFMMGQWAFPGFLSTKLAEETTTINVGGKHKDGSPVNAIQESVDVLKEGKDLVIFPEGMTPTDQGETQPLRRGLDVITRALKEQPVSVVGVTLADPANTPGGARHVSLGGKVTIQVRFHKALDPLLLSSVPGAGKDLLRNLLRVQWHADLVGETGSVRKLDLPASSKKAFQAIHGWR